MKEIAKTENELRDTKDVWPETIYEDLLYPQYLNSEHFPTHIELLYKNKEILSKLAQDRLASSPGTHPDVVERWQYIANLGKKEVDKS